MTRCTHDRTGKALLFGRESGELVCERCAAVFVSEVHWRLKRDTALREIEECAREFRDGDAES